MHSILYANVNKVENIMNMIVYNIPYMVRLISVVNIFMVDPTRSH